MNSNEVEVGGLLINSFLDQMILFVTLYVLTYYRFCEGVQLVKAD
jgi:hypothetical protein